MKTKSSWLRRVVSGAWLWVTFSSLLLPMWASAQGRPSPGGFGMTPEQFWHAPFGTGPRMPLAGDADGDGHADLLSLWPVGEGVIDIARTSPLGKPTYGNVARAHFGHDGLIDACGPFVRTTSGADFLAVFTDGSVRVASGMAPGANTYTRDDLAASIPTTLIPKPPVRAAVGDFDGDGKADVLLIDRDGALLLLRNRRTGDGTPRFAVLPMRSRLPDVRQFSAGNFALNGREECVWLDAQGHVFRAALQIGAGESVDLGPTKTLLTASPEDHLVAGHFRGEKTADILVGQRLLPGGDPGHVQLLTSLPPLTIARDDGPWVAADVDGNGKDDLIRFRRGHERFSGEDTYVHFAYDARDAAKGYFCASNDGLPDLWKLGKIKPGGLDLPALGCKVGHRDIIVEVERFEDVAEAPLRANMERVAHYFAALPIQNPDGTTGIALHVIYRPPWPKSAHDDIMRRFDDLFPPPEHRGIVHTVFAENNGPLVSKNCGDNGHFNGGWPEFLHEFGHQLDLAHEGFWPAAPCALYPSLMSYTYSYSLNDRGDDIGYSDGARASFVVNELHLSERLPFPIEKVKFLAGGPYHFHIEPGPDGKTTLVDWNWNGILGEEDVCADINYSHGTEIGPHYDVSRAQAAPILAALEGGDRTRLLLFYGQSLPGTLTASVNADGLSAAHPGQLVLRVWMGADRDKEGAKWSDETVVQAQGMMGDPTVAILDRMAWVAYPTAEGTALQRVTLDADGHPQVDPPLLVPDTRGAEPTLTAFAGRLALLLWRGAGTPIGLRLMPALHASVDLRHEVSLNLTSQAPVGAVAGAETGAGASLWLGRLEDEPGPHQGHTQVCRLLLGKDGVLREAQQEWVDGVYSTHRMLLLWQPEPGLGPQGRLFHFSGGITRPDKPWAEQYITMNVPYQEIGGGWLYRRYYQPDFTSRSAPAACFYAGNIVYAVRLHDDNPDRNDILTLGFYGNGAASTPIGDFDDISHIRDYGLSRSIKEVAR